MERLRSVDGYRSSFLQSSTMPAFLILARAGHAQVWVARSLLSSMHGLPPDNPDRTSTSARGTRPAAPEPVESGSRAVRAVAGRSILRRAVPARSPARGFDPDPPLAPRRPLRRLLRDVAPAPARSASPPRLFRPERPTGPRTVHPFRASDHRRGLRCPGQPADRVGDRIPPARLLRRRALRLAPGRARCRRQELLLRTPA